MVNGLPAFAAPANRSPEMITFFRNFFASKLGLALAFLFLALIAVAFAASDISGTGMFNAGQSGGGRLAKVGGKQVEEAEFVRQLDNQLDARRQQQPGLDMAGFVASGGFDSTLAQLIDIRALEAFAERHGIAAGKRLIDGQIASIPAFFGPTGQFDRTAFLAVIEQRKLTERQVRADLRSGLIARQLEVPAYGAARMPIAIAGRYASLALEARAGLSGLVPVSAIPAGAPPTDAELNAFYRRDIARYTIPERRVIRYALFGAAQLGAAARPTEAEIAGYYRQNQARYAASETRTLTQIILQDQNAARALEARVRGGTSFVEAARAVGLEPAQLDRQTEAAYGGLSSVAVAGPAFDATAGAILPPQRSPLGWHVVRVDSVDVTPARALAQVRGEIEAQLATQKAQQLVADQAERIEEGIADGSTFDEIVAANRLRVVTSPPITAAGADPSAPASQPDPQLARFLAPMFEAETDDDPLIETLVPNEQFVLSDLDRVIPAAARPLGDIRATVAADFVRDRAWRRAGEISRAIVAKVSRGTPLAQAFREAGVALPAPRPIGGKRRDLTAAGQPLGADLRRLFEMAPRSAKRVEAPNRAGWYVVYLDSVTPGDPRSDPTLVARIQQDFASLIGREYAEQLAGAAKAELGVTRDREAEAALKRRLAGTGGQ